MNPDLARSVLKGLVDFDRPIGGIMEIVKEMDDGHRKVILKEICGDLLRIQFEMIETILEAYPDLRK
jgi:hypothetical protein